MFWKTIRHQMICEFMLMDNDISMRLQWFDNKTSVDARSMRFGTLDRALPKLNQSAHLLPLPANARKPLDQQMKWNDSKTLEHGARLIGSGESHNECIRHDPWAICVEKCGNSKVRRANGWIDTNGHGHSYPNLSKLRWCGTIIILHI